MASRPSRKRRRRTGRPRTSTAKPQDVEGPDVTDKESTLGHPVKKQKRLDRQATKRDEHLFRRISVRKTDWSYLLFQMYVWAAIVSASVTLDCGSF
jgi:hypothetical protein